MILILLYLINKKTISIITKELLNDLTRHYEGNLFYLSIRNTNKLLINKSWIN